MPRSTLLDLPGQQGRIYALGAAVRLLGASRNHLGYTIGDLASFVVTPIQLKQYLIFEQNGSPVAYVAWALLSPEIAAAYAAGERELTPDDWRSGDEKWFIEFVAPFGHGPEIARNLAEGVFRDWHARSLRIYADGRRRVVDWYGVNHGARRQKVAVSA